MVKIKNNLYVLYLICAIFSLILDLTFFTIFNHLLQNINYSIIISSLIARFISSAINYYLNKTIVFKYQNSKDKTLIKYYTLVIINILISALLVEYIYKRVYIYATVIKIIVDLIIFIINFLIQRYLIFKNN